MIWQGEHHRTDLKGSLGRVMVAYIRVSRSGESNCRMAIERGNWVDTFGKLRPPVGLFRAKMTHMYVIFGN